MSDNFVTSLEYNNENYDKLISEIETIDQGDIVKLNVNLELEKAFEELDSLKSKLSQKEGDSLIEECKNSIIDTITSQFGLASLFINSQDGGNVTTSHNFEKGITSSDQDYQKYVNYKLNQEKDWQEVRKEVGYDNDFSKKRKDAFKNQEIIIDDYTGKPLPKDGRTHIDHIVSAKEIESKASNHLHLSPEERAKIATSDENLAWTESSANQSKGDLKMKEWLDKKKKNNDKTNAERFDIDKEKALNKDKIARKYIKKEITSAAFNKYSKELLMTGGKDAAKMVAYSAIGAVMREFTQELFIALKESFSNKGKESLKEIFIRFKNRMSNVIEKIKVKWKDILAGSLEGGLTAFFSNLLVFVINLFATTLKKFVMMIRAGFVSLVQATKIILNPPEGMTKDEAMYQAVKIMTAGLIGAASLGLSAAIEKFLQAIPGLQPIMMFPIPSFGGEQRTVSDVLAVTLSSLLGGLLTTVTIYFMDKLRSDSINNKLQIQLVYQSGVVRDYKSLQSWIVLNDAYNHFKETIISSVENLNETVKEIKESFDKVKESENDYDDALTKLKLELGIN